MAKLVETNQLFKERKNPRLKIEGKGNKDKREKIESGEKRYGKVYKNIIPQK